jgi:tetratricopeptide (TPR) repeat protein
MALLPLGLRQVLESGDCVLFVGAGVGGHLHRPDGSKCPNAAELAQELTTHFSIDTTSTDLAKVAEIVEIRKGRPQLEAYLKRALANLEPDPIFQWLTSFHWRAIFTTNYDHAIERAYELNSNPPQTPISISITSQLEATDPRTQVPIFHLHGSLFDAPDSHVVITQTDYARYQAKRQMLWSRLKQEFATSVFLYLGYSSRDWNWQLVLDEITQEFYPSELPHSYRLDPYAEELDIEILKNRHVETIKTDLQTFRDAVLAELGEYKPDPEALSKYRTGIHQDLLPAFGKNPAALLRLLRSWTYVNGEDFAKTPNTKGFLLGDKPSWSLVGSDIAFRRDIEEDLWDDEILEFATSPGAKSRAIAILASAGYGITTVLMTLAARIVVQRIAPAFMLREGAEVHEGDVQFAGSLFPEQAVFFFVDDAREHANSLNLCLSQLRLGRSMCLLVLGERKNEWRTARSRVRAEEYEIQPLSDKEIDRLLDFLTREHALGKLEELARDYQFAIVKEKHEKQLLVAMREATEGYGFDVIIENEYRGIADGKSPTTVNLPRDLYLIVCCFHQEGVLVRDRLLADILRIPLSDLHDEIGSSLDGLIFFEETDVSRGEYAARTRHRTIADVVWKKCGQISTKEYILQTAMERLNLSYRLDKVSFDKFVGNDDIVANFKTLDGKIRFFETACKREPNNPYSLQHFARMLLREKQTTLALAQIDLAIKMNDRLRVLHHTRGTILAELANTAENEDLGRKWMLQSETEFRLCVTMQARDHYGYQGLASLYLNWAKRVKSEDESADYLTKCEATIGEGLRNAREREVLWVLSAEVQKWLGNEPSRIEKLKKAVSESSASVVPSYLLGRAYRFQGKPEKTIEVLEPVIRSRFEEFRSYLEYVRAMIQLGEPYSKCAAVLSQCRLEGFSDPGYIGLLGGLLFMDGKFGEASKVFEESARQGFSFDERIAIQFAPRDPTDRSFPLRLAGRISTVRPNFVFIQTDKYPDFISRITRVDGVNLQKGMRVTFQPLFNAKGSYADHLRLEEDESGLGTKAKAAQSVQS